MQIKGSHEKSIATADYQAWLFYGPDQGRVSDLAVGLQRRYASKGLDSITAEAQHVAKSPGFIQEKIGSAGLFSPGAALRIREADDKVAKSIAAALESGFPDGRLIVEAGELTAASKLKKLFDGRADCALAACWQPGRAELRSRAALVFRDLGVEIDGKALDRLAELSPPDTGAIIRECQKLAIHANGARITEAMIERTTADLAEAGFSDLALSLCDGNAEAAMIAYWRLVNTGESVLGMLRILGRHIGRLHEAAARIAAGNNADAAIAALRPPVFWKEKDHFKRQVINLAPKQLEYLMNLMIDAERQVKAGGPEASLVGQALLGAALEVRKWKQAR